MSPFSLLMYSNGRNRWILKMNLWIPTSKFELDRTFIILDRAGDILNMDLLVRIAKYYLTVYSKLKRRLLIIVLVKWTGILFLCVNWVGIFGMEDTELIIHSVSLFFSRHNINYANSKLSSVVLGFLKEVSFMSHAVLFNQSVSLRKWSLYYFKSPSTANTPNTVLYRTGDCFQEVIIIMSSPLEKLDFYFTIFSIKWGFDNAPPVLLSTATTSGLELFLPRGVFNYCH